MKTQRILIAALLLLGSLPVSVAQTYSPNIITTAVPFLKNTPDARGASLGFNGVATSPDAFSMFYNPAKYAFMSNDHTMIASGFDFNPNRFISPSPFLLFDAFAQKIGNSAIAATARYCSCGEIEYRDQYNQSLGTYRPREFAVDIAYSYRFGDYLSAGVAGRFIHSSLITGMSGYNVKSSSIAGDVSVYYKRPMGNVVDFSLGASITNIGTKMSYNSSSSKKSFIPTNLRLGTGVKLNFNPKNSLAVNVQFSKLLVPTSPIIARDNYGNPLYNEDGTYQIAYGMDNDVSVVQGMIQSFYDAPGCGYNSNHELVHYGKLYEELCEINTGIGLEYNLADHFFARSGYYYQSALKGNHKYATLGAGMRFGIFGMDLSYAIPVNTVVGTNPYGNVFCWDMYFSF